MTTTCIIFNPTARGEKAQEFRRHCDRLEAHAVLKATDSAGAARRLAAEAVRNGFTTVIAAGGDGTVNEVLNGLADVPHGLATVRFGILPLGTINVFARELGLPRGFDGAWKVIQEGCEHVIDLPSARFLVDDQPVERCFGQLAGAGLDSRAIELVSWDLKKKLGPLAYVIAGVKAMAERKAAIRVLTPDRQVEGELVLLGNGRYYGGSFELFPQADLRDGLLDVTVFPKVDWAILLRAGWGWVSQQLHQKAGCISFQSRSVTLESATRVAFQLDGDNLGHLPVTFSVRPRVLRVLIPTRTA